MVSLSFPLSCTPNAPATRSEHLLDQNLGHGQKALWIFARATTLVTPPKQLPKQMVGHGHNNILYNSGQVDFLRLHQQCMVTPLPFSFTFRTHRSHSHFLDRIWVMAKTVAVA
jgi:hypothetical protein